MMYSALKAAVGACVLDWYECGENPAFFCYRIGTGAFSNLSARVSEVAPGWNSSARETYQCLNPSGIFSIRFTTLKD
jgi:hypothetical protein